MSAHGEFVGSASTTRIARTTRSKQDVTPTINTKRHIIFAVVAILPTTIVPVVGALDNFWNVGLVR